MKTSDMIKELCNKKNISVSELARRIGQTPQNFGKKLKRDTVTLEELKQIDDVMEVTFEQSFVFPNGEQIKTSNECHPVPVPGKKTLVPDSASSEGRAIRQVEILSNKLLTTAFEASLECVTVM